jgi:hypothetical protein
MCSEFRLVVVSKEELRPASLLPLELHVAPSRPKLAELYRASTIFVSTSWYEGFGLPASSQPTPEGHENTPRTSGTASSFLQGMSRHSQAPSAGLWPITSLRSA